MYAFQTEMSLVQKTFPEGSDLILLLHVPAD
jgi:hypothetical protein